MQPGRMGDEVAWNKRGKWDWSGGDLVVRILAIVAENLGSVPSTMK